MFTVYRTDCPGAAGRTKARRTAQLSGFASFRRKREENSVDLRKWISDRRGENTKMRKRWKETAASAVGFGLILLILLAILTALAIFWRIDHASVRFQISVGGKGDSVFRRRYGRQLSYQSDRRALPDALYHLNKITRIQAMILYLLLDTGATALGLLCVDYFMDSVSATGDFCFLWYLLLLRSWISRIIRKRDGERDSPDFQESVSGDRCIGKPSVNCGVPVFRRAPVRTESRREQDGRNR